MLLERERELDEFAWALRQASGGHGGMILVRGPLGCGKSALLRALPALAGADVRVLKADSSFLEQDFAFSVVRELVEPVLSSLPAEVRERWLSGAAGPSRMIFADDAATTADLSSPLGEEVLAGLMTLISNISTENPLLLLLDDVQWLDLPSARLLTMLARQAARMRVLIVATMHNGDLRADHASIAELAAAASRELPLERLSVTAIGRFLEGALGQVADEEFVRACAKSSGGNPMMLVSLAREIAHRGFAPVAEHVSWLRTLRPSGLRERLVHHLELQTPEVRAFARALAVLGDQADLDLIGRLAGLDTISCRIAMRTMHQLGLLTHEHDIELTHAVVKDAIEARSTVAELEQLHQQAARLLYQAGYPEEQVAAQLLETTSTQAPWAIEVLRFTANVAARAGAPEVAARYLRRALLDASPDGEDRARLLVELSTVELRFDLTAAIRHMSYAVPLLRTVGDKASAIVRISPAALLHDPLPLRDLIVEVAAEFGDPATLTGVHQDLALRLAARLLHSAQEDHTELDAAVGRLPTLGPVSSMDTGAGRELLTVLLHAATLTTQSTAAEVAELAAGVLDRERSSPAHVHTALPLLVTIFAAADAAAPLLPWFESSVDGAGTRQAVLDQSSIRAGRALTLLYAGRADEARSAAFEIAALEGAGTSVVTATALSAVALELNDPELTTWVLAGQPERTDNLCLDATNQLLRASAAARAGDLLQALGDTLDCGRRLDRAGWLNTVLFPWQTTAAVLHAQLGDTGSAVRCAEEALARATRWGAPAGVGRALRTLGQVLPGERGTELLREAVRTLESSGNLLELARAQLQLGERLRRAADPKAAEFLRRAYEISVDSGALRLAASASGDLGTPTDTPRPRLTKSESRVAGLAAYELTNQEIAKILGISCRAVEKHLTNSFRKLGIQRRTQLGGALVAASGHGHELRRTS